MHVVDLVQGNVAYHETLNPAAWDNKVLRTEVRYKLLQSAKFFIESLEVPKFRVLDVVLTGSMANYNWTKFSDFDVHVVTDYQDIDCADLAEVFYRAKKKIWNDDHNVTIHGYDVELYVEDVNQPPVSEGVYSILDNIWLTKPTHNSPTINNRAVTVKVQDLIKQIDTAISTANEPNDIHRVTEKLRKMRKAGLANGGEFSVENLAYKILRNKGYLEQLSKAYHTQQDRDLSI